MAMQKTFFQQLGLAAIILLGFGAVIGLIVGLTISLLETIAAKPTVYQSIEVMHDGTPVIRQYTYYMYGSYSYTYFTLDGKEITAKRDKKFLESTNLTGSRDLMKQTGFPRDRNRIVAFSDPREPPNYWYFVHDGRSDGKGYFVGFDSKSKQCIGYIGLHGSCSYLPPIEEWFPMDGHKIQADAAFATSNSLNLSEWPFGEEAEMPFWKIMMISGDQVLEVDLRTGDVRSIIKRPDLTSVHMLLSVYNDDPLGRDRLEQHIIVRTSGRLIVMDSAGKQIASYAIPKDVQQATLNFYELDKEKALISDRRPLPDFKYGEQLTWINTDDKILDRKEVELIGPGRQPMTKSDDWTVALIIPAPIAMGVVAVAVGPMRYIEILEQTKYSDALSYSLKNVWQPLVVVCIIAAVLAWFCYRRQRRMALPWTWVWVGFVFIFGVPGFLAYRFHRRWPVLDNCQVCGQAVPHDREKCSSCGSDFPTPAPKGIEVFA
ncbi:MAG: hypothetical protein ABSE63_04095 [Thermoguttaceae bacterium]